MGRIFICGFIIGMALSYSANVLVEKTEQVNKNTQVENIQDSKNLHKRPLRQLVAYNSTPDDHFANLWHVKK
jgi:hypothetical protein